MGTYQGGSTSRGLLVGHGNTYGCWMATKPKGQRDGWLAYFGTRLIKYISAHRRHVGFCRVTESESTTFLHPGDGRARGTIQPPVAMPSNEEGEWPPKLSTATVSDTALRT